MTVTVARRFSGANFSAAGLGRDQNFLSKEIGNVKGDYAMGRDLATSRYNMANSDLPLVPGRVPTFGSRSAALGAAGYFDTGIGDNADLTIITAVEYRSNKNLWLATQYQPASGTFTSLDITSGTLRGYSANADGSNSSASKLITPNNPVLNDPFIVTLRTVVTGAAAYTQKLDFYQHGVRLDGASLDVTKARGLGTGTFWVGDQKGAVATTNFGLFGLGIVYAAMSDGALLAEVQAITARMAGFGVTL